MKTSKSLNEAIFRAHPSTKNANQSQEQLYHMPQPNQQGQTPVNQQQVPLNESHKNLMQSWMNLRQLDNALIQKLDQDETL